MSRGGAGKPRGTPSHADPMHPFEAWAPECWGPPHADPRLTVTYQMAYDAMADTGDEWPDWLHHDYEPDW